MLKLKNVSRKLSLKYAQNIAPTMPSPGNGTDVYIPKSPRIPVDLVEPAPKSDVHPIIHDISTITNTNVNLDDMQEPTPNSQIPITYQPDDSKMWSSDPTRGEIYSALEMLDSRGTAEHFVAECRYNLPKAGPEELEKMKELTKKQMNYAAKECKMYARNYVDRALELETFLSEWD